MTDTNNGESTPIVPPEITAQYDRLRGVDPVEQKRFYFAKIMPLIRPILEGVPEHAELQRHGCHTLISLMGFSPETTVQVALILRPERLIVVHSDNPVLESAAALALQYLYQESIIRPLSVVPVSVNGHDANQIYERIKAQVPSEGQRMIDITGGTKVMSATAGALAWELNLPICYLDGNWDPQRGSAGLSAVGRLRVIANPSRQRGYELQRTAIQMYTHGNFGAAADAFKASRSLISDSWFDTFAQALSACYEAMADLDRPCLSEQIYTLEELVSGAGVRKLLSPVADTADISGRIAALKRLAADQVLTRMAALLELANIYRGQGRNDFSCLLSYRCMEALVDFGLKQIHPDFDRTRPDYSLIGDPADLARRFSGQSEGLPERVGLIDGFQLLCISVRLNERFGPRMKPEDAVGRMRGVANTRNRSILAHGFESLGPEESSKIYDAAVELAKAVLGEQYSDLEVERAALRPLPLERLAPSLT